MRRKIILLCAGGMSTGMLVKKMEKYAKKLKSTTLLHPFYTTLHPFYQKQKVNNIIHLTIKV